MSCCFPVSNQRQKLTSKMKKDHQQAIEEKDAALAHRGNQIQDIQYENMALQAQRDVYQAQLQRCQDTIIHLRTRYADHARDPGKDNIIIIVRKHTTPGYYLDCNFSNFMIWKLSIKPSYFNIPFTSLYPCDIMSHNTYRYHAFNRFEEKDHVERRYNQLRLIDLTREELYVMGVPTILDEE